MMNKIYSATNKGYNAKFVVASTEEQALDELMASLFARDKKNITLVEVTDEYLVSNSMSAKTLDTLRHGILIKVFDGVFDTMTLVI